jgi:hypothetical protein
MRRMQEEVIVESYSKVESGAIYYILFPGLASSCQYCVVVVQKRMVVLALIAVLMLVMMAIGSIRGRPTATVARSTRTVDAATVA